MELLENEKELQIDKPFNETKRTYGILNRGFEERVKNKVLLLLGPVLTIGQDLIKTIFETIINTFESILQLLFTGLGELINLIINSLPIIIT